MSGTIQAFYLMRMAAAAVPPPDESKTGPVLCKYFHPAFGLYVDGYVLKKPDENIKMHPRPVYNAETGMFSIDIPEVGSAIMTGDGPVVVVERGMKVYPLYRRPPYLDWTPEELCETRLNKALESCENVYYRAIESPFTLLVIPLGIAYGIFRRFRRGRF